MRGAYRKS
jgi:hypothetical protein